MSTAHASSINVEPTHGAQGDPLARVFAQYDLPVVRGEGVWLITSDGRRVLDLYGGHAVAALGYGHPSWSKAVADQALNMNFQSNAVPMDVRLRAARKLVAFSKLPVKSVFFINSGAEANENALKMAFTLNPGRTEVIALEQSFHGRTAGAGALTWGAAKKWYGFPRTPFDVTFLPRRDMASLAQITDKTAAVVVEPIQGVGGAFDLGADYLKALRKRCDETGAVLIFDEVQCGFGRCGQPFAANLYGVLPDMITSAKALGNGFPCAALLMMEKAANAVKMDALGTTFGAGPMASAAIEATIDAIEFEDLLSNVRRVSQYIRNTCIVGPITGHQGAGFLTGLITKGPAKDVQKALLEKHNILAGTSGDPNILRLLPPFTLKEAEVDLLSAALKQLG
jgi:acetylornithine/succinyldiaminopimelate/putrescine aminotransferase